MTMLAAITADAGLGIFAAYGGSQSGGSLSSTARTGDRSFNFGWSDYGDVPITATDEIYIRFAFYPINIEDRPVISWRSGGDRQGYLVLDDDDMKLYLYDGGGTLLDSSSIVLSLNTWYLLEIHVLINDTNGEYEVRLTGDTIMSYSGDTDYRNTEEVDVVRIRHSEGYGPEANYDDIVINDTEGTENNSWPGLGGLYYLKPNAAGDQTDLTPDTGSNHERVDEIEPDDDGSYVESDVVDEYDLYELEDLSADGAISAVIWHARAKLSESGSGNIARMLKIGTTEYQGSDESVAESYADKVEILELNPDDSAAWEKTDIDAIQAGVKVR